MANPRIPYQLSSERAALLALQGKRILVHLVVNVEHWQFDQPMPRTIVTPPRVSAGQYWRPPSFEAQVI